MDGQLAALTTTQVAALDTAQIAALTSAQVPAFMSLESPTVLFSDGRHAVYWLGITDETERKC